MRKFRIPYLLLLILQTFFCFATDELSLVELLQQKTQLHEELKTASGLDESLKDAPASLIVITEKDIKRRAYLSIDEILQDLPSFDASILNGVVYSIAYQRGFRSNWTQRSLILIDGKVDNMLWTHSAILSRQFPMTAIQRIEVLYGPAGVVYGPNAYLGVVNIITKKAKDVLNEDGQYFELVGEYGRFNSKGLDFNAGFKLDDLSGSVAYRYYESDEPHVRDLASWGYADESLLSDPTIWGPAIGEGIDPITQKPSPAGDINLDGVVSENEKFNGFHTGQYVDPSINRGVLAELSFGDFSFSLIDWKTDEGYGAYYSFADSQPNSSWFYGSKQYQLKHHYTSNSWLIDSSYVYRESEVYGDWTESFGKGVSISTWNSYSDAWRIEQNYQYQLSSQWLFTGGFKYEQKDLMKGYMICNYWDGLGICPSQAATSTSGQTSDGSGVVYVDDITSNNFPSLPPIAREQQNPDFNSFDTIDKGIHLQAVWQQKQFRFNGGLRWDSNSLYGEKVSPRAAFIYHVAPELSFKLIYGEAFQEPAPVNLFGGWNGRLNNSELQVEEVKNIELVSIYQAQKWLHEISMFNASYSNVIADSKNVGSRDVLGFEYRGQFRFDNVINNASAITGHVYYTYTNSEAEMQYNHELSEWISKRNEIGDISPHKINFELNLPLSAKLNLNVMTNWSSEKVLFSLNPLRADSNPERETDTRVSAFSTTDLSLRYEMNNYALGLKLENLFKQAYYAPGAEGASAGDDFETDADGFQNSLVPQVKSRAWTLFLEWTL